MFHGRCRRPHDFAPRHAFRSAKAFRRAPLPHNTPFARRRTQSRRICRKGRVAGGSASMPLARQHAFLVAEVSIPRKPLRRACYRRRPPPIDSMSHPGQRSRTLCGRSVMCVARLLPIGRRPLACMRRSPPKLSQAGILCAVRQLCKPPRSQRVTPFTRWKKPRISTLLDVL